MGLTAESSAQRHLIPINHNLDGVTSPLGLASM